MAPSALVRHPIMGQSMVTSTLCFFHTIMNMGSVEGLFNGAAIPRVLVQVLKQTTRKTHTPLDPNECPNKLPTCTFLFHNMSKRASRTKNLYSCYTASLQWFWSPLFFRPKSLIYFSHGSSSSFSFLAVTNRLASRVTKWWDICSFPLRLQ